MESVKHMGEEPIGKLLLRYSLPAIAGFLANALYQFVDRIIVGRGVGTDGIAAVTAAYPLTIIGMAVGLLIGSGSGNRISVLLGAGDREGAERVLSQGLRLGVLGSLLLAILTWIFPTPLLIACGCEPRLLPMAIPFIKILAIGQIFLISLISMGNILRVQGRPGTGLAVMLLGNILNAVLAAIAVFVLGWGVTGTAIATTVSQAIACTAVLLLVQGQASPFHIRRAFLKKDRTLGRSILALGAPFGIMQVLGTMVFLAANHGAGGQGGTQGVAALGVLNTVAILLIYPSLGVMQAMQPLVGYNKGAGQTKRVRDLLLKVLLATFMMGLGLSLFVAIFSEPIAALFSKDDLQLIALVQHGLPWFVGPIVFFSIEGTMAHYFLSVHEPRKASVLLLGRQLLAIPLFLILPRLVGFTGIYLVWTLAALPFVIAGTIYIRRELARLRLSP